MNEQGFGILDNRFLSRSIGLLDPAPPLVLRQTERVEAAIQVLKDNRVGCVVIADEADRVVGIFTERDVLLKLDFKNYSGNAFISEFMTANPKAVTMTDSIAYVLQLMSEGGFRHVPIIDHDGMGVGLVSVKDIVDYIVGSLTSELSSLPV